MTPKSEETDTGRVEVIQADRDAAAAVERSGAFGGVSDYANWIAAGGFDDHYLVQAFAAERHRLTQASPADESQSALPARIGQLQLGEKLSDGDERMCAGGCDKLIPAGHAVYWPERLGEYPDDMDPSCISCAIDKSEREQSWCECDAASAGVRDAGRVTPGTHKPDCYFNFSDPRCQCTTAEVVLRAREIAIKHALPGAEGISTYATNRGDADDKPFMRAIIAALTARPDGGSVAIPAGMRLVPQGWIDRAMQIEAAADMLYSHAKDAIEHAERGWRRFYNANIIQVRKAMEEVALAINTPEPAFSCTTAAGGADREAEIARLREALELVANSGPVPNSGVTFKQWCRTLARAALNTSAAKEATQ